MIRDDAADRERTKDSVRRLLARGMSPAQIARQLGLAKPTITYHCRTLGHRPDERFSRRYDWAVIQEVHDSGVSATDCARRFGFHKSSWFQAVARGDIVPRPVECRIESLLTAGRKRGRMNLKRRLIRAGLKDERCEQCGLAEWRGMQLSMHLHHVNGDGLDNRLQNLELLCPNCHSQTDTYGGRNGHRRRAAKTLHR